MLSKKSPCADLESNKTIFLLIGFVIALSFLYIAFEWSDKEITYYSAGNYYYIIPGDLMEIPATKEERKLPSPPKVSPRAIESIVAVENTVETTNNDFIQSEDFNTPVLIPPIDISIDEDVIVDFLPSEDMPGFKGNLFEFLAYNLRYPPIAEQNNIQGKVICQFVVEKDGSISNIVVLRSDDSLFENEAIRVIKLMPQWRPGMQSGKPVRVRYTLPVAFVLKKK